MLIATENSPPLDFEDAVSEFITHMKTAHNITPVNPMPEQSAVVGNVWHLRNGQGLLARVDAGGKVS